MGLWPVFVAREMYQDTPVPLRLGDEAAWDMLLVDGEAEGWPAGILVETTVRVEQPPVGARHGLVARTPELAVCWGGRSPIGAEFRIRAGLVVDCFNPPFRAIVSGTIRRLLVVSTLANAGAGGSSPAGGWRMHEIHEAPRGLRGADRRDETWSGLLLGLAVDSYHLEAFL